MLKFGIVSEVDPAKGMARVKFDENGGVVSPWLFIGVDFTKDNKEEKWVDENEHVACMMTPDMQQGIILKAIFDDENAPEQGNIDIWVKKFKDGTFIAYHRGNHKLVIEGDELEVEINCQSLTIDAPNGVDIDGDLAVSGALDVAGNIDSGGNISADGNVNAQGNVAAQGDVTAGGGVISLIGHKHIVTSAPGTTGPSIP